MMMWLNWSVATINTTLQLLVIYRLYIFSNEIGEGMGCIFERQ